MRLFAPEPPRLELRVPTAEDATEWYALFRDTRVMEYLGRPADSLAHYEDMVVRTRTEYEREGFCLYTVLTNGEVAGFTGAHRWLNDWGPVGEIELAWRLGCAFWGEGIATRAAQQVMGELAEAGHQQVFAVIHARNRASMAVAQRLGMHQRSNYEARLKGLNLPVTEWVTDLYHREQNPSQHRYNDDSS